MNFDLKKKKRDQNLKSVSFGVHPRFPNRRQTLRQDSLLIGKNIPGASYSLLALLSHLQDIEMRACLYTQEISTQYGRNYYPCGSFRKVSDPQILDGRGLHCCISVCDTRVVHKSHSDFSSQGLSGVDTSMHLCPRHLCITLEVGKGIRSCIQVLSLKSCQQTCPPLTFLLLFCNLGQLKACLGLFFRTSQCASADGYFYILTKF